MSYKANCMQVTDIHAKFEKDHDHDATAFQQCNRNAVHSYIPICISVIM